MTPARRRGSGTRRERDSAHISRARSETVGCPPWWEDWRRPPMECRDVRRARGMVILFASGRPHQPSADEEQCGEGAELDAEMLLQNPVAKVDSESIVRTLSQAIELQ